MKKYEVLASQLVFYRKVVTANSLEEAENAAWEEDCGDDWKDIGYGDWELDDVREIK